MDERYVDCSKLGGRAKGLERQPFPGAVGRLIFENVSKAAWDQWREGVQIKLLNEYRLNMGDQGDYEVVIDQMLQYFNLKSDEDQSAG